MYNKIKRELYATDCEIKFDTANQLPVFWLSNVQKMKKDVQLTRMMDLMPSDFTALNSTLPACAMIPNQQNFTRHDERFSISTIFSDCQIGQVRVSFKSDQAQ